MSGETLSEKSNFMKAIKVKGIEMTKVKDERMPRLKMGISTGCRFYIAE